MAAKAPSIDPPTAKNTGAPWSVAIIQTAPAIIVTDAASRKATRMRSVDEDGFSDMVTPGLSFAILDFEARQRKPAPQSFVGLT